MIDSIDTRLLFELNWNCRQNYTTIGKKLRISKQVVSYRIHQLEKKKIIRSYHALIDWRKLGYSSIRVYIKWHNITPEIEEQIYKEMKEDPFFMWTVKFEGDIDVGFYLWVDSISKFSERWFSFIGKYRKYILKQEIYESVNMIHYPMKPLVKTYPIEQKNIGVGEPVNYDKIDYDILKSVTNNGKIPLIELAEKIGLTPKATIYRLKKLEKSKIIMGYNAVIDTNKLGYNFYKIDFYLNNLSLLNQMHEFARANKKVIYQMRTIGGPDFEIEIMVQDANEMKGLIEEIRREFPGTIEFFRFHRFEYVIKQVYLPGASLD